MDQGGPASELTGANPMNFDLNQLADRVRAAADRSDGLTVTVSGFDLILSKDGYGTNRSESIPFASLFLNDRDVLGQAMDRLKDAEAP
jgi:hypothetical protein